MPARKPSKAPRKAQLQAAARALGLDSAGTKSQIATRVTQFGYNAVEDKGRRQAPQTRVKHEDLVLTPKKRSKLNATVQDQVRNLALVAWMIRKHLDYVSKFHVSFRTEHADLDAAVNRLLRWHGSPRNMDIARRFGRDEMMRFFELEKVVNGDAAMIKINDGIKLQAIESDLIAPGTPEQGKKLPKGINASGLIVDEHGGTVKFSICNRGPSGKTRVHDHLEPAENVIFDAYWTRFASQFRGVSPLSTAINTVQDLHESFEYNQVKLKMHSLFGIALMRGDNEPGEVGGAGGTVEETTGGASTATDSNLDFQFDTVNVLDMMTGDQVEVIESKTPSAEFVNGSYLFIQIAMLALDIPVTSFDSRRSNFSARIADLNEYQVSVESKQTKNRYVLQDYSDWLIDQTWSDKRWGIEGHAKTAEMDMEAVKEAIIWVPAGAPWLDKKKQLDGDKLGIELGLDNAIDAARRRGSDVFANIDKQEKVIKYAAEHGVPLTVASTSNKTIEDLVSEAAARGADTDNTDDGAPQENPDNER